jgi:hypothetical protein
MSSAFNQLRVLETLTYIHKFVVFNGGTFMPGLTQGVGCGWLKQLNQAIKALPD